MRDLSRGDRGKEVLDVQTRLRGQGFELGREGVDGFFGPSTRARRALVPAGARPARRRPSWAPTPGASWSRPATRSATACSTCASRRSAATTCCPAGQAQPAGLQRRRRARRPRRRRRARRARLPAQRRPAASTASSARARSSSSRPLRKAESGREGKKIPERDGGYVAARSAHGTDRRRRPRARRRGRRLRRGGRPGREGLHPGARPAPRRAAARRGLPRAAHARDATRRVPLYARCRGRQRRGAPTSSCRCTATPTTRRPRAAPPGTTSSAATTTPSTAAGWPTTSGARLEAAGAPLPGQRSAATTACCARPAPSPCWSSRCS